METVVKTGPDGAGAAVLFVRSSRRRQDSFGCEFRGPKVAKLL